MEVFFLRRALKLLAVTLFLLSSLSCSRKSPDRPRQTQTFEVTFAVVLIPDTLLEDYGGSISKQAEYKFNLHDRYVLAEHLLENLDEYPSYKPDHQWRPLLVTGSESRLRIAPSFLKKNQPFEAFGIKLSQFEASIKEERLNGASDNQIECTWECVYGVELQEPIGNSTSHGGNRPSGFVLLNNKPDMTPFYRYKGHTLWMIVKLQEQ